jgi:serine/threonine protein kinase
MIFSICVLNFTICENRLASFEEEFALDDHLGPLGEGSFGVVWKCERKITGEKFAVKVIKRSRLTPIDLENLLGVDGEVALHRQLRHDNIVTLRSSYEDLKCVALVLNWCQGGDLFDLIVSNREKTGRGLPESVVAVAMSHVLSALKFIHQNKIVHRDVKCENILLEFPVDSMPPERNTFKLCDFGLARRILDGHLTDAAGSPDTVAPEMMHSGRPYAFPVDVWSCGVCAYMGLSAMPPFWGATDHAVMQRVKQGHYSTDGENWTGITDGAKGFVHALMKNSRNFRVNREMREKICVIRPPNAKF